MENKKNDILLINPKIQEAQTKWMNKASYGSMTMSLGALAGYLGKHTDAQIKILDEAVSVIEELRLRQEINNLSEAKIVGISAVTITVARAFKIAELIKKIDNSVKIIIGGVHVTALPEEALAKNYIDIVARGEGEATLLELYKKLKNNEDLSGVLGISYKKNGKYFHNPARPMLTAEEIPPFPYELFDEFAHLYKDFNGVISSRGCPYNCIFCSQRIITGRNVIFFPVERVINDIKILTDKYKSKFINFLDDNFCISKERLNELLDAIIASGYHKKVCFNAQVRADTVTPEIIKKLKEANFTQLNLGMESGSNRLLGILRKMQKVEDNVRAIKISAEYKMPIMACLIFGLPTETRQERLETAKLVRDIPLTSVRFNIAIPYPGTELYNIAKNEGRLNIHEGWKNFSVQSYLMNDNIPYVAKNSKKAVLIYDTFMANVRFYLRWKIIKENFNQKTPIGGAITLKEKWYLSRKEWIFLTQIALWVAGRSFLIIFRYWLSFLKKT